MANICCDDVIFYTEGNPEGLYDLWEDLETYIILNQNPDLCWIGNLFSHKKIDSTGISLRGNRSAVRYRCARHRRCSPVRSLDAALARRPSNPVFGYRDG